MNDTFSTSLEHYQLRRGRLISLTERLLALLEALHIPTLWRELQHVRMQINLDTIKILVAGELNAGKSTIINALLKTKVLPAYPVPTTALVTHVKMGTQAKALLQRHPSSDGRQQPPLEVALSEMEPYLVFHENDEQTDDFVQADVFLPLPPIYDGIEFIDVIGPYDDDGYDEALEDHVPSADVVLYAPACDRLPSKEEVLRIDWIRNAGNASLLFLCNRFDLVDPRSQNRIKRRYLAYLSQRCGAGSIFFTNAKGALDGHLRGDMVLVAQSALPQVEEMLYNAIARRGKQKMQSTIATLHALIRLSQQVTLIRMKLRRPALQTREDSLAQLLREYKWIDEERQRWHAAFSKTRQRIGKEAKSAAIEFYCASSSALDSLVQGYIPQQPRSMWEEFSGDDPERLAKNMITFLTEATQNQFQTWIALTLESLLQRELNAISVELERDAPAQIARAVMRRINRIWHPTLLIKQIIEDARLNSCLEPRIDLEQMRTNMANLYRRLLDESALRLIQAITNCIDDELCQRQQQLTHRLDLQLQCLSDIVPASLEEEQEYCYTVEAMPLLLTLEHELAAIERALSDL